MDFDVVVFLLVGALVLIRLIREAVTVVRNRPKLDELPPNLSGGDWTGREIMNFLDELRCKCALKASAEATPCEVPPPLTHVRPWPVSSRQSVIPVPVAKVAQQAMANKNVPAPVLPKSRDDTYAKGTSSVRKAAADPEDSTGCGLNHPIFTGASGDSSMALARRVIALREVLDPPLALR